MKPSIGRIVHYVIATNEPCAAAIIVELFAEDRVGLTVFYPTGTATDIQARYDETGKRAGSWHWPERTE